MEKQPRDEADQPVLARNHFHLTLGLVFIPYVAVAVGWILAIVDVLRGHANAVQARWTRLLVGLVVADAFFVIAVSWVLANPELTKPPARPAEVPRIGVVLDPTAPKEELRIGEVLPGTPASRAGIEPGDVVERIDGDPVSTAKELRAALEKGPAGASRTLVVRRGEVTEDIPVTPESPVRASRGLFEPRESSGAVDWAGLLIQFLPAAGAGMLVWLLSLKRARVRLVVWRGLLIATVGSVLASVGTGFLVRAILGGWSIGGALLALVAQMSALLGLTQAVSRLYARDPEPPQGTVSPLRAGLQGLFYLITGVPRVSLLLWMADQVFFEGRATPTNQVIEALAAAPLGAFGTGLFVFAVVFLGPLAEETLFRGFLLPRLAAQWGGGWALFVSSLIFALFHPHYGMYMPVVFLYGWVFGWARLRSGGIGASWALHMAVNGTVSAIMLSR